ncbi:MAG: hypothetical protein KDA52_10110 [Planctomycetaceae bacterium]|nr:hypothetical protein [Planctomycetaceae bacterium]
MSYDPSSSESSGRKWWLIPVGCLGAVVFCCGLPLMILPIVFGAIKSSTPYQESLTRVQANPACQQLLVEPIAPSFLVSGSINVNGPEGHAAFSYDVSGPQGTANVVLDADKVDGKWIFNTLMVHPSEGGASIDLLGAAVDADATVSPATPATETDENGAVDE